MQYEPATILNKSELSYRLYISEQTIENMVKAKDLPQPIKIGNDMYWTELAIELWWESWLDEQENWKY